MTNRLTTRLAIATGAAALAISSAASPASAASYVDKQVAGCASCATNIAVYYWYKSGSSTRGVSWVDTAKMTKSNKTVYARWTYQKPGGAVHVGKSWKKATDEGDFMDVNWYAGGKHKGPTFPKNTKICTQFKGYSAKPCVKLK